MTDTFTLTLTTARNKTPTISQAFLYASYHHKISIGSGGDITTELGAHG